MSAAAATADALFTDMPLHILGISAFYHDSAAALVRDGEIIAAAQEERFTRIKGDESFPDHAVSFCLRQAGIRARDIDYVAFNEKPLLKFERILENYLGTAPRGLRSFAKAMPVWLKDKIHMTATIRRGLGGEYRKRIIFPSHHESHAASAFFPSPFQDAAILTLDGVGEWATASLGEGQGGRLSLNSEMRYPHSLGLLYSAFTYYCGFKVNSGEYKLMGLAPYGEPKYAGLIREHLLDLKPDGSLRLDLSYFNYCAGLTMTSPKFHRLLGGEPRQPETRLNQRDADIAASIQLVCEEAMLRCATHLYAITGHENLCLAGGVALNCVGNGRILRESPFRRIWIQPAAGDAGGALGAALFVWHQLLGEPRTPLPQDSMQGALLGPASTDEEILRFLDQHAVKHRHFASEDDLCETAATLLADGKVVGWMQGRMEFGPRALGARSILGDPRRNEMQSVMNLKIKFRESFRPFAPVVLAERAAEYFETGGAVDSPYMLVVAPVKKDKLLPAAEQPARQGIDRIKETRSVIPAVTHVDGSARLQTADPGRNPRLHRLLTKFSEKTGCPVLINTSFNVRGEPIVCSPEDAYRCFMATDMDALALGGYILLKEDQPKYSPRQIHENLQRFAAD